MGYLMTQPLTPNDVALCRVDGCNDTAHARNLCGKHYKRWGKHRDPLMLAATGRPRVDPRFVFAQSFDVAPSGCWLWKRHIDFGGYGTLSVNRKPYRAHRFSYELIVGPIPTGLYMDHLCRVRNCVNPLHLEPVSERENALRGLGPSAINAAKIVCKEGHEFTPENTLMIPRRGGVPYRRCRECNRVEARAARVRRAAA